MTLQGGSAMSRMLGLVDSLLVAGRKQQQLGREGEALKIFKRLASFGDLPEVSILIVNQHRNLLYGKTKCR